MERILPKEWPNIYWTLLALSILSVFHGYLLWFYFQAMIHVSYQKTILCVKLTNIRCAYFPDIWISKEIHFYCSLFVCFHIPKKLQSSVLFLAGQSQTRAGRVSFMQSIKESTDKNTCTGNMQTLTSLSKIQQETAIVRTVLLPGDLIVPQASVTLCAWAWVVL